MNAVDAARPLPTRVECTSSLRAAGVTPERDFLLTLKEVESMSGWSRRTLRKFIADGKLGCVRANERVMAVPLSEWRLFIDTYLIPQKTRKKDAAAAIRHNSTPAPVEGRPAA